MPYLIGTVTKEEKAELIRRGWDMEAPPGDFVTSGEIDGTATRETVMVWVDQDLFVIMSGPEWDTEHHQCVAKTT